MKVVKHRIEIQALAEISMEKGVQGYALKITRQILNRFDLAPVSLEQESRDALNNSVKILLKKINSDKWRVPENIVNLNAFLMSHLKTCLTRYLLTRYARRTEKKPTEQYQKEIEKWNEDKSGPKPSRYLGNRFINFEEHLHSLDDNFDDAPSIIYSDLNFDDIRPLMLKRGLKEREAQVIELRIEGHKYEEIAKITGNSKAALFQRYKRAIKKLGIKKDFLK